MTPDWPTTPDEATRVQRALRERLVLGVFGVALAIYTGIFATWHWVA